MVILLLRKETLLGSLSSVEKPGMNECTHPDPDTEVVFI